MGWNYRLLAHEDGKEVHFKIHEVYYDASGTPDGYSEKPITVGSETIEGIVWNLNEMVKCTNKPILWAGKNFPREFKKK